MKIVDTEERYKPSTGFAATATYDVRLGESVLTKLELFTKEKTIQLDEEDCGALNEALKGKGWVLTKFRNKNEYSAYGYMSGSLDGGDKPISITVYDEEQECNV